MINSIIFHFTTVSELFKVLILFDVFNIVISWFFDFLGKVEKSHGTRTTDRVCVCDTARGYFTPLHEKQDNPKFCMLISKNVMILLPSIHIYRI